MTKKSHAEQADDDEDSIEDKAVAATSSSLVKAATEPRETTETSGFRDAGSDVHSASVVVEESWEEEEAIGSSSGDGGIGSGNPPPAPSLFCLNGDWQLTWPIWHMLPRSERKGIALRHGYKTIGEFEEYMSLQRAVGETSSESATTTAGAEQLLAHSSREVLVSPYDNQLAYLSHWPDSAPTKLPSKLSELDEDGEQENDCGEEEEEEEEDRLEAEQLVASSRDAGLPALELVRVGGSIMVLPEETLHRVFGYLPVDAYATLALVSPHWKSFTRTEVVYRRLCERLYLNQSRRRVLHVHRFDNSYRTMLERRPRVRAGGGVYVLKYTRVQPIQRDMWTEVRT
jgi:F-box protein 9